MPYGALLRRGRRIADRLPPRSKRLGRGSDGPKSGLFLLLFLLAMIYCAALTEAQADFPPWDFVARERAIVDAAPELSWPASLLNMGSLFFSKYVSPVDGDRCPMYPTCAAYSRQALRKHGFAGGVLLTVDRLLHEGDEMHRAPQIMIDGRFRFLDAISNNDFWWH